jgi:hypothetical protein
MKKEMGLVQNYILTDLHRLARTKMNQPNHPAYWIRTDRYLSEVLNTLVRTA